MLLLPTEGRGLRSPVSPLGAELFWSDAAGACAACCVAAAGWVAAATAVQLVAACPCRVLHMAGKHTAAAGAALRSSCCCTEEQLLLHRKAAAALGQAGWLAEEGQVGTAAEETAAHEEGHNSTSHRANLGSPGTVRVVAACPATPLPCCLLSSCLCVPGAMSCMGGIPAAPCCYCRPCTPAAGVCYLASTGAMRGVLMERRACAPMCAESCRMQHPCGW